MQAAGRLIISIGFVAILGILARVLMLCANYGQEVTLPTTLYLLLLVYLVVSSIFCLRYTRQTKSPLGLLVCAWSGFLAIALMVGVDLVLDKGVQLPGILIMLHLGVLAIGAFVGKEQSAIYGIAVAIFLAVLGVMYRDIGTSTVAIGSIVIIQAILDACGKESQ